MNALYRLISRFGFNPASLQQFGVEPAANWCSVSGVRFSFSGHRRTQDGSTLSESLLTDMCPGELCPGDMYLGDACLADLYLDDLPSPLAAVR
jgi:hypothetical protein